VTPYANLSGDSGVRSYSIGVDSITVEFQDGYRYLYNHASAGKANVEQMIGLARAGRGLSTFISRYVRGRYASKSRA
jgi:hypothetical protein